MSIHSTLSNEADGFEQPLARSSQNPKKRTWIRELHHGLSHQFKQQFFKEAQLSTDDEVGNCEKTHTLMQQLLQRTAREMVRRNPTSQDASLVALKVSLDHNNHELQEIFTHILSGDREPNQLKVQELAPFLCCAVTSASDCELSLTDYLDTLKQLRLGQLSLKNVSEKLCNDRQAVIAALHYDGMALQFASKTLQDDKEVVFKAVQQEGMALEFAGPKMKNHLTIVLKAVEKSPWMLEFASARLKNNCEVVFKAVQACAYVIQFAGPVPVNNSRIMQEVIRENALLLSYAGKRCADDWELVDEAVRYNGAALAFASARLKNDIKIVTVAVSQYGSLLQFAGEQAKNDFSVVALALATDPMVYSLASPELQADPLLGSLIGMCPYLP